MFLKKDGVVIIDHMIGKFKTIIEGLNEGIKLVDKQQNENESTIASLRTLNDKLVLKAATARQFRENLVSMITAPVEVKTKIVENSCDCK